MLIGDHVWLGSDLFFVCSLAGFSDGDGFDVWVILFIGKE